jgi:hypothetical protein
MHADEVEWLMGARIVIEHNSAGWIEIFKSDGMKSVVDAAGERIAAEAGEHFEYTPATKNNFTVAGFVSGDAEGDELEATDKVLTRAVHR